MAKNSTTQLCYLIALLFAVALVVYGFMELLKEQQPSEKTQAEVISRQIRGFALIMLAQVVLVLGAAVCFGTTGGVESLGKALVKTSRS